MERDTSSTSKGNQLKWYSRGYWIKADLNGYQGMAEWVASEMLKMSNLPNSCFVEYQMCKIIEQDTGIEYKGCLYRNLLQTNEEIITFERLFKQYRIDYNKELKDGSTSEKTYKLIDMVKYLTGVDVTEYLRIVFTLDTVILNEDRHLNNLALISTPQGYKYCPIFDNGYSLLSDLGDYPLGVSIDKLSKKLRCKPFGVKPDTQYSVLGAGIVFNKNMVLNFLNDNKAMIGRVYMVIKKSMRDYPELFV